MSNDIRDTPSRSVNADPAYDLNDVHPVRTWSVEIPGVGDWTYTVTSNEGAGLVRYHPQFSGERAKTLYVPKSVLYALADRVRKELGEEA